MQLLEIKACAEMHECNVNVDVYVDLLKVTISWTTVHIQT